jgi:thiol:disulfide interchange protein DsbA
MRIRLLLPLFLTAILIACGGNEQTPTAADATPPPSATPETATVAEPAAAAADAVAEAAAEAEAAVEAVTESAGEIADEAQDESVDLMAAVAKAPAGSPSAARTDWRYTSGDHYSQLTSAQGTADLADGVEVAEVFWYGCNHCFNFDPYVDNWKEEKPDGVKFVRLPVMWNPTNEIHARIFYTAEALGKLEQMHPAIFRAIHLERKTLTSEEEIREFFGKFDVDADSFDKTFRSFAVESKLKKAKGLTARYRIRSVPVLVVNGKYLTDGPEIKSFDDMLAVVDELVEREQQDL